MKKITLCLMLIVALTLLPITIFATEPNLTPTAEAEVEMNGSLCSLTDAVSNVTTDTKTTIKLLSNCEVSQTIHITDNKNIVIDLNGFDITGTADPLFKVSGGSLEVTGEGTITGEVDVFYLLGNTTPNGEALKAEVKIGANVEVVSNTSNCVYLRGNGAKADIYGNLTSSSANYAAIQGNGTKNNNVDYGNTEINVYEGARVVSNNNCAIFHPQSGKLTVYGGLIKGKTGIEMRAGSLTVKGGEIMATADNLTVSSNPSGSTTVGAAIAIAQHTTGQDTKVVINGGKLSGYTALNQSNIEGNSQEAVDNVSIKISGGTFEAINGGTEAVYSENKEEFITGGTFAGIRDIERYLSSNMALALDENGNYVAAERTIKVEGLEYTADEEEAEKILLDSFAKWEEENPEKAEMLEKQNVTIKVEVYELDDREVGAMPLELWEGFENALKEEDGNATLTKKFIDISIWADGEYAGTMLENLVEPITFKVTLSEGLPELEEGFTRKCYAVKYSYFFDDAGDINYEFDVQEFTVSEDGKTFEITLENQSLFGIGYTDIEDKVTPPADNDNNENQGTVTPPADGEVTPPAGEDNSQENDVSTGIPVVPQTGDSVVLFVALAGIAAIGILKIKRTNLKTRKH